MNRPEEKKSNVANTEVPLRKGDGEKVDKADLNKEAKGNGEELTEGYKMF